MAQLLWGVLLAAMGIGVLFAALKFWNRTDSLGDSLDWDNGVWLGVLLGALLLLAGIALIYRGWSEVF